MKPYLRNTLFAAATLVTPAIANADDFLSIGSCPVGCAAYTWSAGIVSTAE